MVPEGTMQPNMHSTTKKGKRKSSGKRASRKHPSSITSHCPR
ncbi:hypothetical protein I314_00966 [Cryptococcus bacillisporus CA1873]|uniref:Uncharacterized protein n=1 Tax=Cryptococcus bacillisporus CA1873 TaxID=1296111 RepID=A0ABR5BI89_CRYGA|nr:hypothetical protein I314_00966 [Cryptococcus bacillisporus CA1873]|eukprot:KIR68545.1 hypothetical protein I314_00966 [Cryptococcus gattii CA1873]